MSFERRQPEWVDVALVPEPLKTRGLGVPTRIEGALRIGLPMVRRVTADDLEGAAAAQVRADAAAFQYHLVELACSLRPPDKEAFARAFVGVQLDAAVVAYSLDPLKQTIEEGRTTSLGLSADLGFITVEAEREKERSVERASVVAYGLRTAEPSWELSRVDGHDLQGSYFFALLARSPAGVATTGMVGLSATLEKWRFRRFEAEFPGGHTATFALGAA